MAHWADLGRGWALLSGQRRPGCLLRQPADLTPRELHNDYWSSTGRGWTAALSHRGCTLKSQFWPADCSQPVFLTDRDCSPSVYSFHKIHLAVKKAKLINYVNDESRKHSCHHDPRSSHYSRFIQVHNLRIEGDATAADMVTATQRGGLLLLLFLLTSHFPCSLLPVPAVRSPTSLMSHMVSKSLRQLYSVALLSLNSFA